MKEIKITTYFKHNDITIGVSDKGKIYHWGFKEVNNKKIYGWKLLKKSKQIILK